MPLLVVCGGRLSSVDNAVVDGCEAGGTEGGELVSRPCCMRRRLLAFSRSISFFDPDEERDFCNDGSFGDSYIPLAVEECCCVGVDVRDSNAVSFTKEPLNDAYSIPTSDFVDRRGNASFLIAFVCGCLDGEIFCFSTFTALMLSFSTLTFETLTFSALTFSKLTTALLLAWRLRSSRFCSNCVRQHHSEP